MPSVRLKRLNVNGVDYVVVDEDSPLLPTKGPEEKRRIMQRRRRRRAALVCLVAVIVCIIGLPVVKTVSWFSFAHREQESISEKRESTTVHATPLFQRARVRVREDRPNFPSFWNYAPRGPINVTYDKRSLMLNGERALFLSGSMHPVRATRETWNLALDEAVRQGLNMITIYIFWAAHQPFSSSKFDWSFPGGWDLGFAIRAAANRGLFCHIRIGPYTCGEYSYGGIPEWVPLNKPNMVMRRLNKEWMHAMKTYVKETVRYLTQEQLWAHQGGPILLGQIENELGGNDDDADDSTRLLEVSHHAKLATIQDYAEWCGDLVARVAPQVVWTMCNGLTATNAINTCNGYGGTSCSTTWLENHGQTGRIQVDQPALWTEDEQGFQDWGEDSLNATDYFWGVISRQMAREGLQWFARGGSHLNYYMWWGGYNRGRAAASGIMNMYASDACLCSSGQRRQPKYGHLQDFHEAITSIAPILTESTSALGKEKAVEYRNEDGDWKVASKRQRMFVYGNASKEAIFLENDADESVEVRVPISRTGTKRIFDLYPMSSALLVDGSVSFDSSRINPRNTWYSRSTVPNAVKLLDWQTWSEQRGADATDARTVMLAGPIEQTKLIMSARRNSDYAWYETDIDVRETMSNVTVRIETQKANAMSIFVDGHFLGSADNHEHAEGNVTLTVFVGSILAGKHKLAILSESLGYYNLIGRWGASTKAKPKGITGNVVVSGTVDDSRHKRFALNLVDGREWRSFPGLHGERGEQKVALPRSRERKQSERTKPSLTSPCSWSSVLFDTPSYDPTIQALFLDITSGRGHIWFNGFNLGRFWNITRGASNTYSQRYYFLPSEFFYNNGTLNKLTIFNALGGNHSATNLVLSWLEMDEDSFMQDEIDWPPACI